MSNPTPSSMPSPETVAAFFQAVIQGDVQSVELALQDHPELGMVHQAERMTALMLAALHGHAACVNTLLPHSNPMAQDEKGTSALIFAVFKGNLECVKWLAPVSCGHHKSHRSGKPLGALALAAMLGNVAIAQELLASPEASCEDYWGMDALDHHSALVLAAGAGHLEMIRTLFPVFPNHRKLALGAAAKAGRAEVLEWLIHSVPPSQTDQNQTEQSAQPRLTADRSEPSVAVRDLLQALQTASAHGQLDCVKRLVQNIEPETLFRQSTALVLASVNARLECVRLLLNHCDPHRVLKGTGTTALMAAAFAGHRDCVELLSSTQNLHARNSDGETALMLAAQLGHVDCVQFLFDLAGDSEPEPGSGQTALVQAAERGMVSCVRVLMRDASPDQLGTAFAAATQYLQWDAARLLGEALPSERLECLAKDPWLRQQARLLPVFERHALRGAAASSDEPIPSPSAESNGERLVVEKEASSRPLRL